MTLRLRWHEAVAADIASVRRAFGQPGVEATHALVTSLLDAPLQGDWLERHGGKSDLSACRKIAFGPDEVDADGTNLGPALRLVYRLLPSNTAPEAVEILAVAPRRDLEAYAITAARLAGAHDPPA